jgi:hypothetical protein
MKTNKSASERGPDLPQERHRTERGQYCMYIGWRGRRDRDQWAIQFDATSPLCLPPRLQVQLSYPVATLTMPNAV